MIKLEDIAWLEFLQPVIDRFVKMGNTALDFFPQLVLGIILLVVLMTFAKIIRFISTRLCRKLKVDALAERLGVTNMLSKIGMQSPLSKVIGTVIYWMIALLAVKTVADIWGIADISNFIDSLIKFLPKLFVAVSILFAGLLVADMARNAIQAALDRVGVDYAGPISNVVYTLLAVMIITVVLGLLGIETELLNSSVIILLGAFSLAVALSLGLGLRTIAKNIVSGVYARDLYPPGSIVEVDDMMVVVREVGAVATRLESDNGIYVVIPNSILVGEVNRGARSRQEFVEKG
ncbi:MAG: mechanosensitive ion channel [Verrucomicrobiales bacterium]|nr:mechanosensitive ion channel [Verrucomicrobiales bacterium]